jgi:hypothetical protein
MMVGNNNKPNNIFSSFAWKGGTTTTKEASTHSDSQGIFEHHGSSPSGSLLGSSVSGAAKRFLSGLPSSSGSRQHAALDVGLFMSSHRPQVILLERLLSAQEDTAKNVAIDLSEMIQDRRVFCAALVELHRCPCLPVECGERQEATYEVRAFVSKALGVTLAATAADGLAFAGWCLWLQHKARVYLTADAIKPFCRKHAIDAIDMFEFLIPHANRKGFFTTPRLRNAELGIRRCLQAASWVTGAVEGPREVQEAGLQEVQEAADVGEKAQSTTHLDAAQLGVLKTCLASPVSCISGGAGVGKTTVLGALVATIGKDVNIVCMAFTHKARRVLQSKLGSPPQPLSTTTTTASTRNQTRNQNQNNQSVQCATIHSYIAQLYRALSSILQVPISSSSSSPDLLAGQCGPADDDEFAAVYCAGGAKTSTVPGELHQFYRPHFFIIDEASMVDLELFSELAHVIMEVSQVVPAFRYQFCIVGDDGQLQPIGRGELFRELCNLHDSTPTLKVCRLNVCYRTDSRDLFDACSRLRQGFLHEETSPSWVVRMFDDDAQMDKGLSRIIRQRCKGEKADALRVQYIAWQNKDVRRVNVRVQQELLAAGHIGPVPWHGRFGNVFYKHDRVVFCGVQQQQGPSSGTQAQAHAQTHNHNHNHNHTRAPPTSRKATDGVTNAMTGTVADILQGGAGIRIVWDGAAAPDTIIRSQHSRILSDLSLSYCMTVHKAQGSEYDCIVVPCFEAAKMLRCLDRRWLYTAATRAKVQAMLLCTPEARDFVEKDISPLPVSGLAFGI